MTPIPIAIKWWKFPPSNCTSLVHRLHQLTCIHCGEKTRAVLPVEVEECGYGARVVAIVSVLSGMYRHSVRMVVFAMDRYGAYNWVDVDQRQLCWAHLKREFTKISERQGRLEIGSHVASSDRQEVSYNWHGTIARFRNGGADVRWDERQGMKGGEVLWHRLEDLRLL